MLHATKPMFICLVLSFGISLFLVISYICSNKSCCHGRLGVNLGGSEKLQCKF